MGDPNAINEAIDKNIHDFSPEELEQIKKQFGSNVRDLVYEIFTCTVNNPNWSQEEETACDLALVYLNRKYPFLNDVSKAKVIGAGKEFWYGDEE